MNMTSLLTRLPKGYWSGLVLGLSAFGASALALSLVYWVIRPFVWAAVYQAPYTSPPGALSPQSGEWLFMQLIYLSSAIILGRVVRTFSGAHGYRVLISVVLPWALLLILAAPSQEATGWRLGLTLLKMPIGVVIGYWFLPRGEPQIANSPRHS